MDTAPLLASYEQIKTACHARVKELGDFIIEISVLRESLSKIYDSRVFKESEALVNNANWLEAIGKFIQNYQVFLDRVLSEPYDPANDALKFMKRSEELAYLLTDNRRMVNIPYERQSIRNYLVRERIGSKPTSWWSNTERTIMNETDQVLVNEYFKKNLNEMF